LAKPISKVLAKIDESSDKKWFVYILECKGKLLYTGMTNDLKRRFKEHKSGNGGKFTRTFKAKKILYFERFDTRKEAMSREARIKRLPKLKKLALISAF